MATTAQGLTVVRDRLLTLLQEESLNPKPAYVIDGESVDWATWAQSIQARIDKLNSMIQSMSPYIVSTRQSL